jgi:hypothetical protein
MPFRATFDCLWCGAPVDDTDPAELPGWAQLCAACVEKADDNPFVRFRVERATADRATARGEAVPATSPPAPGPATAGHPAGPGDPAPTGPADVDGWYLRRGPYAHGPVHDTAWHAEVDAAGRWLDELPFRGRLVELGAATGWWSPLLAGRGELTAYDAIPERLDRARDRLLAHGLRAHLHVRDPWARPEPPPADAVFGAFVLDGVERERLPTVLELVRQWLRPGGRFATMAARGDAHAGTVDGGPSPSGPIVHDPDALATELDAAGFVDIAVTTTGRFFVLATGRSPGPPRP